MKLLPEHRARLVNRLLSWLLMILWASGIVGCSSVSALLFRPKPPAAVITTPGGGSITQDGSADKPATLSSDRTEIDIPVSAFAAPAGVPPAAPAGIAPSPPPAPATVKIVTTHDAAAAPRAFTPPAPPPPPSAAEVARADVFKWFCVASLLGLLAAGVLAYLQHYLACIKVAAGAVALPVLGHFFSSAIAIPIATGLVCLGGGLFIAWHVLARRFPALVAPGTPPP